jgi:hypothetical protein
MLDLLGTEDPVGGRQLAATDPPQHTKMSARLKKALAVKNVDRQRKEIRKLVLDLILPIGDGGVFDFGPGHDRNAHVGHRHDDGPATVGLAVAEPADHHVHRRR